MRPFGFRFVVIMLSTLISAAAVLASEPCKNAELIFADSFEQGRSNWETTDDAAWELHKHDAGKAFGLNRRISDFQPEVRSPHNIALIKGHEVGSSANPGLRDVRCAHIAPPWAVLGSPRCGCRGESQRAGDTNPGLLEVS
jgi:hypothetical protein